VHEPQGDSGFIAVRQGLVVARSRPLQHWFDCPYQVSRAGRGAQHVVWPCERRSAAQRIPSCGWGGWRRKPCEVQLSGAIARQLTEAPRTLAQPSHCPYSAKPRLSPNAPSQLGAFPEFVEATDTAAHADVFEVPLLPGDVVVVGKQPQEFILCPQQGCWLCAAASRLQDACREMPAPQLSRAPSHRFVEPAVGCVLLACKHEGYRAQLSPSAAAATFLALGLPGVENPSEVHGGSHLPPYLGLPTAGSDGLWDNAYDADILALLPKGPRGAQVRGRDALRHALRSNLPVCSR
jgi:hypothetical protein